MADAPNTPESKSNAPIKPEGEDKKKQATKPTPQPKEQADKPATQPKEQADKPATQAKQPARKGQQKETKTGAEKKAAEAQKRAEGKKGDAKPSEDVKIVDKPTPKPKHVARAKPNLTPEQKKGLQQRRQISDRRPWFRRQQWYEYKKLADSGWRKPRGVDSAMRRHFGYEQSVVRIGFGGPAEVRGLHPSGFREVYVDQLEQLKAIDTKTQAARVSGRLGARKLKLLYAEADKLGVRILNRRNLE